MIDIEIIPINSKLLIKRSSYENYLFNKLSLTLMMKLTEARKMYTLKRQYIRTGLYMPMTIVRRLQADCN